MQTLPLIKNLKGTRVLLRVDFNVPIANGRITDDFRIRMALPTIEHLRKEGARIILVSHIEKAESDTSVGEPTLGPVAKYLATFDVPVTFIGVWSHIYEHTTHMQDGDVVLLENIRTNAGEKENDMAFAKELSSLADIYVNDAFSVSHRAHASVSAITQFLPSYAGIQFEKEVKELSKAFSPEHPFVCIIGGAKFDTKLPLITKMLDSADYVAIVGALANDALKAQGHPVGVSKVSKGTLDISDIISNKKVIIPTDVVVQDLILKDAKDVAEQDMILDVGVHSIEHIVNEIQKAKLIVWNGPTGLFEKGFNEGTLAIAKALVEATKKGAYSIVGGGDTLSALSGSDTLESFSFVSTGGGAMLDFLAQGSLPGIEALEGSK